MEYTIKTTLDELTSDSVSVLTQKFVEIEGEVVQVGPDHRKAYVNSEFSRQELQNEVSEPYLTTILTLWGDELSITE